MIRIVYTFRVSPEQHEEYLRATKEIFKPFWEKQGCLSYNIYQECRGGTKFLEDMTSEGVEISKELDAYLLNGGEMLFFKEVVFEDLESMLRIMSSCAADHQAMDIMAKWRSYVTDVTRLCFIERA